MVYVTQVISVKQCKKMRTMLLYKIDGRMSPSILWSNERYKIFLQSVQNCVEQHFDLVTVLLMSSDFDQLIPNTLVFLCLSAICFYRSMHMIKMFLILLNKKMKANEICIIYSLH